jgi:hypothetical protein
MSELQRQFEEWRAAYDTIKQAWATASPAAPPKTGG